MGMTARCLLDTDVAIEALRKRDQALLQRMRAERAVALSAVSLYELRFGAARSSDAAANHAGVDELAAVVEIVDFDAAAARAAGEIRAHLARKGTPIGPYDVQIAGQARSRGLVLVTRNQREFKRVKGLAIERW